MAPADPPEAANKLKVTAVLAEDVRMVQGGGRAPDTIVKIRLLSKKNSTYTHPVQPCSAMTAPRPCRLSLAHRTLSFMLFWQALPGDQAAA